MWIYIFCSCFLVLSRPHMDMMATQLAQNLTDRLEAELMFRVILNLAIGAQYPDLHIHGQLDNKLDIDLLLLNN